MNTNYESDKIQTWQQWLQCCGESWKTEGNPITPQGKIAHKYLKKVKKEFSENLISIAAKAWKEFKNN